jgi:intracellular septation protein
MSALASPTAAPAPIVVSAPIAAGRHPLLHALRWIGEDLFSTLAFVGLYAVTHSAATATLAALATGLGQMAWERLRGRPVYPMQAMSLALVAVFGAAALLTHDPRFIMLKPTLVYAAVAAVMLKRGWMIRYMPEVVLTWSADLAVGFGYVWAGLMAATSILNAVLALAAPWAWGPFIAVAPITSKAGLVLIQYGVTKALTRRRIHAARREA